MGGEVHSWMENCLGMAVSLHKISNHEMFLSKVTLDIIQWRGCWLLSNRVESAHQSWSSQGSYILHLLQSGGMHAYHSFLLQNSSFGFILDLGEEIVVFLL